MTWSERWLATPTKKLLKGFRKYRAISFLTVVCKLSTKIISNKISATMGSISPDNNMSSVIVTIQLFVKKIN